VTVRTQCQVTDIQNDTVTVGAGDHAEQIPARTTLWAAGMKASGLGRVLAERTGAELDRAGRVMVEPDLSIADHPNIFAIGDLAHFAHQGAAPLPGVAPVAMQQGRYVAKLVQTRLTHGSSSSSPSGERSGQDESPQAFRYRDKGSLAVIGRNAAVAELGSWKSDGFLAWLIWVFVHIGYLIEFDNKLLVLLQWAWNYFTRKRGARLITGDDPFPLVRPPASDYRQNLAKLRLLSEIGPDQ
jgi:NADH dehydrogenase